MAGFKLKHRINALFFLIIFSVETFYPGISYALTSGPTTPEMTAFEPASTSDMVDLFSGDFSYNIPLMDVGGYPVNLAYHSGAGPEEEASWVGAGWSLNPGAINRQLRGLPDDFNGDIMTQDDHKKANITIGANVNASIKLFGIRLPKIGRRSLNGNMKVKVGIMHNNYTGYKGMIGIGTAFNASDQNSDEGTKGLGMTPDLSASLGLNVDNQSGINPYANFEVNYKITTAKERKAEADLVVAEKENIGKTIINSIFRSKCFDLTESKAKVADMKAILNHESHSGASFGASSAINFNGYQPPAQVQTPMISKNFTASLALGITLFGGTVAPGIEGTYSRQELAASRTTAPAYGFMNGSNAKSKQDALLDYNMEKESPYFKRLPNLGVTVFTPDLYSVSSNAGSMQFRPYLRGSGIFFQPHKYDEDKSTNIGLEPAWGNLFHIGVPLQLNKTNSISGKWTTKNEYLNLGDFKPTDASNPANQSVYFKRVGEKSRQDMDYFNAIGNTAPVAVRLDGSMSAWAFGNGKALAKMRKKNSADINNAQARTVRDKANNSISYLTASEAAMYALEKEIPNYRENTLPTLAGAVKSRISRVSEYRKPHHISQYTVTQEDGQRMVYGNPVYNTTQEEVSFAVSGAQGAAAASSGIVQYTGADNTPGNQNGKDQYYHKSIVPAYTTGHLLTAILSPDYVDVKGDGVTDDDLGTAVKFNYSELSDASGNATLYNWRTPFTNQYDNTNTANYNEGYKSIADDDKANYTWGQKELWNLHSIESKTMVAQFYTEDRKDGIGVSGENGGKNGGARMKRLTEIRLYSKADLYANGANAVPIKTVHLEYYEDYPLLTQLPNNIEGKGKLTLKRIWFSYGNNLKGKYNAYNFNYKIPENQVYQDNQSDRWGIYKPQADNPNGLTNLEFPYSTQNKSDADENASNWQLNQIELPSGGVINVKYESDDYAYVQDKRAAQMCFMAGIGAKDAYSNFTKSDKIYVKLPVACTDAEFTKRYLEGLKSLAYRAFVDLDGRGHFEYVSGYADIASGRIYPGTGNSIAEITVGKISGYNPVSKASWQKLKLDLPRYAYPEYDNIDAENSGFISAIRALGATFGRFKDLIESFDARADRKGFGNRVDLTKSWVRLCTPIGINNAAIKGKLGGGHRVKEIRITDNWSTMSGVANAENGSYGQTYDYTTEYTGPGGNTETISSGVASYEPTTGGDENPFHEPINYTDKHLFGLPKYFYLERPMGESYFPGASIGYSKVTVRNIGADGSVGSSGKSVSEFYTAKDFPTRVDELPMERKQPKLSFLPRLFGAKLTSGVTVSQGYVVENNDMHGKPKGDAVYDKNGNKISSAEYYYKTDNPAAEKLSLNNSVPVIYKNGTIENNSTVGMDIDMFTEMNESMMENMGVSVDPSFGIAFYGFWPKISIRLPLPQPNYEKRLYRGSTTIKLVNRYAVMQKVVKIVNGSKSTSENMLWDAETGEVLLTKTNNEFEQSIYSFSYPAHWVYDGMGSAFKNEGVYLAGFASDGNGAIINNYNNLLMPGDEIIDVSTANKYWVSNPNNNTAAMYLIDKDGNTKTVSGINVKILRSGRRNLSSASVGTVISMSNPIAGGTLNLDQTVKILQAKAVEYSEDWKMPVSFSAGAGGHYTPTDNVCSCLKPLFDYLIATNQLFITQAQNKTVGQLIAQANAAGYNVGSCSILDNNANKSFYALTTSSTATIYTAQVGDCKVSIRSNNSNPVTFAGLVSQPCGTSSVVNYNSSGTQTFNITLYADYNVVNGMTSSYPTPAIPTICNGQKLKFGHTSWGNPNGVYYASVLRFPGIFTEIPTSATIISANLHLFAHPDGFNSPTEPNAHTLSSQISPGDALLVGCREEVSPICSDNWGYVAGCISISQGMGLFNNVTAPFQDLNANVLLALNNMRANSYKWFIFRSNNSTSVPCYGTVCSQTYPDPSKRPYLDVTYTIPGTNTNAATLQIDDCVSAATCIPPVFNPYTTGFLGNWRTKRELVYDAQRVSNKINAADPSGTDLRNSGYFDSFDSYWKKFANYWIAVGNAKWQWTTASAKYNRKGQEIENTDALGRFSSAQQGYLETVPVAVAGNAMYREIGYDGFEDYNFNLGLLQAPWDSCAIQDHFSFRHLLGSTVSLDNTASHTGKYSLKLNGTATLIKPTLLTEPASVYVIDANRYKITNGYLRYGFMPVPAKKYILSGWVKDGQPKAAAINGLTLKISGTSYNVNDNAANPAVYSKIYVVEGWKRFEVVFTMPASGDFKLELGGSNINVDDIRIHPYDAQLKSYAYDASSMRLMADLDENNFATFYEYDDEGTLIRVKKETEKGISTIKETRSSVRRREP